MSYPSGHGTLESCRQGTASKRYKKEVLARGRAKLFFSFFLPAPVPSDTSTQAILHKSCPRRPSLPSTPSPITHKHSTIPTQVYTPFDIAASLVCTLGTSFARHYHPNTPHISTNSQHVFLLADAVLSRHPADARPSQGRVPGLLSH